MSTLLEDRPIDDQTLARPMLTRPLGSFPWDVSVITLGGVKWDTQCSDSEAVALIQRARELGVNTFDTAHGYGDGESERKLGLALADVREKVWINTKTMDRTYDGAMREMEISLERLRTEYVDVMFVHSVDHEEDYRLIMSPNSVLRAMEEMRDAGRIRHIGVSGHWVRDVMAKLIQEYTFEAVLFPAGLFNMAYDYSFIDTVLPIARSRNMAVLGMKVMGAGRVRHAASVEPYLRYSLDQPIDTAVIGAETMEQLEQNVRVAKSLSEPLTVEEQRSVYPEALEITREFGDGEFNWVSGYPSGNRSS